MSSSGRSSRSAASVAAVMILAAVAFATLLAGCGAGAAPGHAAQAGSPASRIPLTERLIDPSFLPGLHGILMPTAIRSPAAWEEDLGVVGPPAQHAAETLKRLGFLAAARQTLFAERRSSVEVISIVERFRSRSGARGQLARAGSQPRGPGALLGLPVRRFQVPAIPGSRAAATAGPSTTSQSIAFASGPFYYQVVLLTPRDDRHGPSRHELIAACAKLWGQVRNAPAT